MGFSDSEDAWRARLAGSRDDWREIGAGESSMVASVKPEEIGVGDAISTTLLKVTLWGRGDDSMVSGARIGEDDDGKGVVATNSAVCQPNHTRIQLLKLSRTTPYLCCSRRPQPLP